MSYSNTVALPRVDISSFLEETHGADVALIAQKVLPVIDLETDHGRYPRIRRAGGGLMKLSNTKRGPDGSYPETQRNFDWDTYDVQEYGSEERIDDKKAKEYKNFFDVEKLTAKYKYMEITRGYEKRVADLMQTTGGADVGLDAQTTSATVAYTESNLATFDLARDIQNAQERAITQAGVVFNTMVLSLSVFNRIRRSTKLQNFLFSQLGTGVTKLISARDLVEPFDIPNIVIAKAAYDAAASESDSTNVQTFWGNDFIWLLDVKSGDVSGGGLGRTITWSADCPGGLFTTETYRDEKRRGDMVRVRSHTAEKLIDVACCQRIATGWA
jgi:hypothetical protein